MQIIQIDPETVTDNPYQPRKGYSQKKIDEIALSIGQNGLLETPVGRQRNGDVELAFGHIRKRAFIKLKKTSPKEWPTMPVEIREISDQEMAVFALEENLKRSDITPIDLARSITKYFEVFTEVTETKLAEKLSMTQGNISNMRRVMRLPDEILQKIDEGRVTFTMARELLIFEGLSAPGKEQRWSRKEGGYIDIPRDSKWLMLDAIKGIATPATEGRYGAYPATVDGMQKTIHSTVAHNFKPLGTGGDYSYYRSDEVLFDVDKAGCKACQSCIKTHPTKSHVCYHVCYWCTKPACWEKKQEAHKEQRAAPAKKKMEEDILSKAAAVEAERQAKVSKEPAAEKPIKAETISQEILPSSGDIINYIPEEEREAARERIKHLGDDPREYPCRTCLNVGRCDGTGIYSASGVGPTEVIACDNYMGKQDAEKVREKATLKVPSAIIQLTREKAGSRAEVLDLNELRVGYYGQLKQGYVLLDDRMMSEMDNPKECLETCTQGFHYAFDSKSRSSWMSERETKVSYVCTNPKCVSKKKAAYTRAKNATGQAKKKAEAAAIKQVLSSTTTLDHARLKVIIDGLLHIDRYSSYLESEELKWFAAKLKVDIKDLASGYGQGKASKRARIFEKLNTVPEEELAKLILEFSLTRLMFSGDIKEYKILTTEALSWMGVGINIKNGTE